MKIVIHVQDLEARGDRWKYTFGECYVIRNISEVDLAKYDNVYFKEFLENHFNSSYTGLAPTQEYERQSYIHSIDIKEDNEEETDPWIVPYELKVIEHHVDADLARGVAVNSCSLFASRFCPREDHWSTAPKYQDIIGYVEQCVITPTCDHQNYKKEYVSKDTQEIVIDGFTHNDFSRKPYDMNANYDEQEAS
jgi:hypothetical protein